MKTTPQAVAKAKVEPLTSAPHAPKWLPDEGKDLWRRVAPKLVEIRLLTRENLPGFEALCSVYGTARQADEVLRTQGLVMSVGEGNYRQQRPEVSISLKNWSLFRQFANEFGLTPAGAARLGVEMNMAEIEKSPDCGRGR